MFKIFIANKLEYKVARYKLLLAIGSLIDYHHRSILCYKLIVMPNKKNRNKNHHQQQYQQYAPKVEIS